MSEPPIRRTAARAVYANDYVRVYDDDVTSGTGAGTAGRHLRIEPATAGPGAVVIPLHAGRIGLVQVYRYPLGAWQWALPRGFAHGADPLATARAELFEEIAVAEAELRLLGFVTPDSGLLSHRVAVVLADVLVPAAGPPPDAEVAAVRWVPTGELTGAIASGGIEDGFTLAALCLARAHGVLPGLPA